MATKCESVRNPFKCPFCNVPYSSSINSDNAPIYLTLCAHSMCLGCAKKKRNESEEKPEPVQSPTIKCAVCDVESQSKQEPNKLLTLIDIMLEIQSKELSRSDDTTVEAGELASLKCPGCHTTFSYNTDCVPYILHCGHAICVNCVNEKKRERSQEDRDKHLESLAYQFECIRCPPNSTVSNFTRQFGGSIKGWSLNYLEKQKEERFKSLSLYQFTCLDCKQKTSYDRGFLCTECTENDEGTQKVVCGYCTLVNHKTHVYEMLLNTHLESMKDDFLLNIQSKIAKCNLDANGVVEEYKRLLGKVEERFSSVVNTIPLAKKCSDGMTISLELKEKADEYEGIMEGIVPSVRKSNKLLEDIISKLAQSFPDLVTAYGESKEKEETADGESEAKRPGLEESEKEAENSEETEI